MTEVDVKHRTGIKGKYSILISKCPHCDIDLLYDDKQYGSIHDNIIGFNSARIGEVAVVECPKCFEHWFYHSRLEEARNTYHRFLDRIEMGKQKHFNNSHNAL